MLARMHLPLFSNHDYRRLWFIGFAQCVVRWLETLALALFAYRLSGSAFIVAMLTMLRLLPMALFGAFIGAAAERFERRRVLAVVVAMTTAVSLSLAILASLDIVAVWHLGVASFVNGIAWVADNPVRRMMIGDVVGVDRISPALSVDTATNQASRILGPVLSGLLIAGLGIPSVFWFSVILYLPGLFLVRRIGTRRQVPSRVPSSIFSSVREGFAWARRDERVIGVFLVTIIFNLFGWPTTSMVPVIGTDHFRLDPKGVGLLAACDGAGGLLGALYIGRIAPAAWYGRIYVGAVAVYFTMIASFALAPGVALAAPSLFVAGVFQAMFAVMQTTLVYRTAPVEMRARLLGVLSVCIGTGPLGFYYLGVLADSFSPRIATTALVAQGMVVLAFTWRYWRAALRI